MVKKDFFLGIFLIAFSFIAYLATLSYPYQSAYFPRVIIVIIGLLGLFTAIRQWTKLKATMQGQRPENSAVSAPFWQQPLVRRVAMMMGSGIIFLILMSLLGFFVAGLIYLPVMIRLLGVRKITTIAISTLFVLLLIYSIFVAFLRVPFPEGIIF